MPFSIASLIKKEQFLKDKVMSAELIIRADVDKSTLNGASQIAHDLEGMLSAYRRDSYISLINQRAGKGGVKCPSAVIDCVKEALATASLTKGRFDPTIGILTQGAWGFGTGKERVPYGKELDTPRRSVNYRYVEVKDGCIALKRDGMALDLGGVGKGYAASLIAGFLREKGALKALVSIGGEICCYGKNWNIGIKHPRREGFLALIVTNREDTTISTSGDYERYIKNHNYHHILDPKRGSQNNYYSSLTVKSEGIEGAKLDALTTALFNMKSTKLLSFAKELDLGVLVTDKDVSSVTMENLLDKVKKIEFS